MTDEQRKNEQDVTPEGAVEIEEEALEQAAGGASSLPMESISLNYAKIEYDTAGQKVAPQDASIGLLRETEKKS